VVLALALLVTAGFPTVMGGFRTCDATRDWVLEYGTDCRELGSSSGDEDDPETAPIDVTVSTREENTTRELESDYNNTEVSADGDSLVVETVEDTLEVVPKPSAEEVEVQENTVLDTVLSASPEVRYNSTWFAVVGAHATGDDRDSGACNLRVVFEASYAEWQEGDGFRDHAQNVTLEWKEVDDPVGSDSTGTDSWEDTNQESRAPATLADNDTEINPSKEDIRDSEVDVWMNRTLNETLEEAAWAQEQGYHVDEQHFVLEVQADCQST